MPTDTTAEARKVEEALKRPTEQPATPQSEWRRSPRPGENAAAKLIAEQGRKI